MRPVTLEEIVLPDRYPALRDAYRAAVIAHKKNRRLAVGEKVTLVFEDHETLRFQIQEMTWIERIESPEKIQEEIDVYNELMPRENELSATLFVEITETPQIRAELDRLVGIDEHVSLCLGEGADAVRIPARFDPKQLEEERISAVQYIRFRLDEEQARRFRDTGIPATVRIDHPEYRHEAALPVHVRESLCASLDETVAPLLPVDAAGPPPDTVVFESARVLARRPRGAPGYVIVETREAGGSLLDVEADLLLELLDAVKQAAAELVREHGRCRVRTDLGPGVDRPRWHVFSPKR